MSCKSAIYTADPSSTVLTLPTAAGTAIPLGTTIRRFGCNAVLSGNGVLLKGQGHFDVDASVTFTPTAAGAYTVMLFKDGIAVPGATQTVTAAAAGTVSVNIPAIVRNQCCDSTSTLTFVITSASGVDYAALMGVLDNHMSCIKAVCPKEYDAVMSQIHALR